MIAAATRVVVVVAGVLILGGALTGCGRDRVDSVGGAVSPATGVTASTPTPAAPSGADDSSLQSVQGDLDSADSATTNAGGDVSDADSAATTNDSP